MNLIPFGTANGHTHTQRKMMKNFLYSLSFRNDDDDDDGWTDRGGDRNSILFLLVSNFYFSFFFIFYSSQFATGLWKRRTRGEAEKARQTKTFFYFCIVRSCTRCLRSQMSYIYLFFSFFSRFRKTIEIQSKQNQKRDKASIDTGSAYPPHTSMWQHVYVCLCVSIRVYTLIDIERRHHWRHWHTQHTSPARPFATTKIYSAQDDDDVEQNNSEKKREKKLKIRHTGKLYYWNISECWVHWVCGCVCAPCCYGCWCGICIYSRNSVNISVCFSFFVVTARVDIGL